ncbi:hypothetical protein ALP14_200039 [Pseudomonas amygdali pv. myricae]|nr:hypothetical protein ALP14_200039 [Pseudomonas amygdali pv. myricae]
MVASLISCNAPAVRSMADAGLAVMKANQGALQRLLDGIGRLMGRR